MKKSIRILVAFAAIITGLVLVSSFGLAQAANAATQHSLYGQCGGTVSSGSQLYHSWQAMGVVSQASIVARSAGFHRMDNSLPVWMNQRVVRANLARAASPIDYGCHPGNLFSVGHRLLPKGTPVMVALPSKYSKTQIRTSPHKGFGRIVVRTWAVGKSNCSNPLKGAVYVVLFVKGPPKPKPPKPKPPAIVYSATATATAEASATCPDGTTAYAYGYGYGSATSTISQEDAQNQANAKANADANAKAKAGVTCGSSSPPPSVSYSAAIETINDIPAGSCRPVQVTVNSTVAGTVMIAPQFGSIGSVDCWTPSSEQPWLTENVAVGSNTYTVYVWAPSDPSATSDTLTVTPNIPGVNTSQNTVSETYTIDQPTRP